jgi:hypothetical protein
MPALITALNELAVHILHGVPSGETNEDATAELENGYGDHSLEAFYVEMRTQRVQEAVVLQAAGKSYEGTWRCRITHHLRRDCPHESDEEDDRRWIQIAQRRRNDQS